ncbi:UNVERIFIED_ORG: type III secretory pathway component EscS [Pseudomonas reinekei]|nr:type III secretory pathway component EscS [Pseudomonas reinekei]
MKQLVRIFAALFIFVGILAGSMTAILLLILMVRFPPLLIAAVLTCLIFSRLRSTENNTSG